MFQSWTACRSQPSGRGEERVGRTLRETERDRERKGKREQGRTSAERERERRKRGEGRTSAEGERQREVGVFILLINRSARIYTSD